MSLRLPVAFGFLLTVQALSSTAVADTLWYEGFEGRSTPWKQLGSSERTDAEAWQGRRSLGFTEVSGHGDAVSHPIRVEPGTSYFVHLAYLTRGGGGYLGVEQLDERGKKLTAVWLIGDGGCCTEHVWSYAVGAEDPEKLGVWEARSVPYDNPGGVHFVRLIVEDWSGGLPDDPEAGGVFFDSITFSTSPEHHSGCADVDGDGHCAGHDNCERKANPKQRDLDLDGQGNACDSDRDGDGQQPPRDCDDLRRSVHLGAKEACDDRDSNCDGSLVDEFPDPDGDGVPDCDFVVPEPSPEVLAQAVGMPVPGLEDPPPEAATSVASAEPSAEQPDQAPTSVASAEAPRGQLPRATQERPPAGFVPVDAYAEPARQSSPWTWVAAGLALGALLVVLFWWQSRPRREPKLRWSPKSDKKRPPPRGTHLH